MRTVAAFRSQMKNPHDEVSGRISEGIDRVSRLPCALGQNPRRDKDAHHRHRRNISEESPVRDVIRSPW